MYLNGAFGVGNVARVDSSGLVSALAFVSSCLNEIEKYLSMACHRITKVGALQPRILKTLILQHQNGPKIISTPAMCQSAFHSVFPRLFNSLMTK
jgi:hypothetical protein